MVVSTSLARVIKAGKWKRVIVMVCSCVIDTVAKQNSQGKSSRHDATESHALRSDAAL